MSFNKYIALTYCIALNTLSLLPLVSQKLTLLVITIGTLLFLIKEETDFWYIKVKRWVVVLPTLFYTLANNYPNHENIQYGFILKVMLAVNIAMAGIFQLFQKDKYQKYNGIYLLILSYITPTFSYDNSLGIYGFEKNILWQFNFMLLLSFLYTYVRWYPDKEIEPNNFTNRIPYLYSVIIPPFISLLTNKSHYWTLFRVYILYYTLIIDSLIPQFQQISVEQSTVEKYMLKLKKPWLFVSSITIGLNLYQRLK
tara:strand:+ start:6555 stop:7316 length:762 start_codon:yes stop_codon:yes gene_type:complete